LLNWLDDPDSPGCSAMLFLILFLVMLIVVFSAITGSEPAAVGRRPVRRIVNPQLEQLVAPVRDAVSPCPKGCTQGWDGQCYLPDAKTTCR